MVLTVVDSTPTRESKIKDSTVLDQGVEVAISTTCNGQHPPALNEEAHITTIIRMATLTRHRRLPLPPKQLRMKRDKHSPKKRTLSGLRKSYKWKIKEARTKRPRTTNKGAHLVQSSALPSSRKLLLRDQLNPPQISQPDRKRLSNLPAIDFLPQNRERSKTTEISSEEMIDQVLGHLGQILYTQIVDIRMIASRTRVSVEPVDHALPPIRGRRPNPSHSLL